MNLVERDARVVWHPYTQMLTRPDPLPVIRAGGVYLYTEDGRRILDGISSWWVNIHGHSHPVLNAALADQARRLEHVMFAGCTPTRMVFLVPSVRTCVTVPWPAFVTHAVPSATSTSSGYDSTGAGFPIRRRVEASTRGTS